MNAQTTNLYAEINVGDKVIASPDGAFLISAYVHEIHPDYIVFEDIRSGCLFDCERGLAEAVTILLEKFQDTRKALLVNDIMGMIA